MFGRDKRSPLGGALLLTGHWLPPMCKGGFRGGAQRFDVGREVAYVLVLQIPKRRHTPRFPFVDRVLYIVSGGSVVPEVGAHAAATVATVAAVTVVGKKDAPPFHGRAAISTVIGRT